MTNLPYIILNQLEPKVQIKEGLVQKTLLIETFLDEIVEIMMKHGGGCGYDYKYGSPIQIFYVENNQWHIFEFGQYEEEINQHYKKLCLELYGEIK